MPCVLLEAVAKTVIQTSVICEFAGMRMLEAPEVVLKRVATCVTDMRPCAPVVPALTGPETLKLDPVKLKVLENVAAPVPSMDITVVSVSIVLMWTGPV